MDPTQGFSPEQVKELQAHLDKKHVKKRNQAGRSLSYIEGWHAIAEANRIFGFDGWHRETTWLKVAAEAPRKIGAIPKNDSDPPQRDGWGVTYTATVRVLVFAGSRTIIRDGTGAGHGIDVDLGQAHESAIKEAETDAMKRALMTFGNPLGLALYDKQQREVGVPAPAPALASPAPAAADPPLVEQARTRLQQAGLTLFGIAQFAQKFGTSESLSDVPDQTLQTLIQHGIKPTTVDELNE